MLVLRYREGGDGVNLFRHRSFAFGCAIFLFVLFISKYASTITRIAIGIIALFCLLLLCTLFLITKREAFKKAILSLGAVLIMTIIAVLLTVFVMDARLSKASLCDSNEHVVVGKVDRVLYKKDEYAIYSLDVSYADDEKNKFKVCLIDDLGVLKENDIITARVTFVDHPITVQEGITFSAITIEYTSIEAGKNDFVDYLRYTNKFLDSVLRESLNDNTYSLMSAMFLGNVENLSSQIYRDFTRIGLVHILSLSGMHVSIVVSIIGFFISKLRARKWIRMLLISLLIFAFIAITGFSDTALRAGFMQFVFFGAFFIRERTDLSSALFLSVFAICLIDPFSVFSLSLHLSFLAMLGCIASIYFIKRCDGRLRIRSKILRICYFTLVTTIFVTFITLPVVVIEFGQFSLFSFLSNLIITPILNLLIYLAPLMLIVAKIPVASSVVASVCEWICKICLEMSSFASRASFSAMSVSTIWQFIGVSVAFFGVIIFILLTKKQTRIALICFLGGILIFASASIGRRIDRQNNSYIYTSSISENDAIFVESKGKLTVIEACNDSISIMASPNISSYLGYTEIENYVTCDYSYKTKSYIDELTDQMVVRNLYLQVPANEDEVVWHDLTVKMLRDKGICVKYIEKSFYIDDIKLDFCTSSYVPRSTKRAVAFSLLVNDVRLTYLGASSYELANYFPCDYASSSELVIFGAYGPTYTTPYDYELRDLDGYTFFGKSYDFASNDVRKRVEGACDIGHTKIKIGR